MSEYTYFGPPGEDTEFEKHKAMLLAIRLRSDIALLNELEVDRARLSGEDVWKLAEVLRARIHRLIGALTPLIDAENKGEV